VDTGYQRLARSTPSVAWNCPVAAQSLSAVTVALRQHRSAHLHPTLMRRTLLMVLLLSPSLALASWRPGIEIFGGYSNLNANIDGWNASGAIDFTRWLGVMADGSAYYATVTRNSPLGVVNIKTSAHAWFVGPQVSLRRGRITLSGHILGGNVDVDAGLPGLNLSASESEMTYAVGGNFDVRLLKFVGIRVAQGDYIPTNFVGRNQHNGRVSAGLVFVIGPK
jgi:hypothetical protein